MSISQNYELICLECRQSFEDSYLLRCPEGHSALLRTEYPQDQLQLQDEPGLFQFINWLPVTDTIEVSAKPITYHAKELGDRLGLENLYVSFNGYWPEKGGQVVSCSFKEYEAYPTLQRMKERREGGVIQVSSAGNTARAFAIASSNVNEKVILVVPMASKERVWTLNENHDHIFLIGVDGDYYDAIKLGQLICQEFDDVLPEGGARNVARRDGMGLTMVDAVLHMKQLPDFYFQGVGSGTGGIAAYEMALKLQADGRFPGTVPRFFLSQNKPFTPMVNAWDTGRQYIEPEEDMPDAEASIKQVYAPLLTNRQPPYSIKGGVFDILTESNGGMLAVTNAEAKQAYDLFEEIEGIDIDPSAAVALASLIAAIDDGIVKSNDYVMLNVSGGGYKRIEEDNTLYHVALDYQIDSPVNRSTIELIRDDIEEFLHSELQLDIAV